MRLFFPLFLVAAALWQACSTDSRRDIHAYYFPVKEMTEEQWYVYASEEGDTSERRYWCYRGLPRDSGLFLEGTQYDRYLNIVQTLREKIVDNGSLARYSLLFDMDTATGNPRPVQATIKSPDVFPFLVTDSLGVFLFRLQYHPPDDSLTTLYIIRNRKYLGDGPDFEFRGQKYPTVRFRVRDAIGNEKDGASEVEGEGEEWYARGIGLVYYRKSFAGGKLRFVFRLKQVLTRQEMENRSYRKE